MARSRSKLTNLARSLRKADNGPEAQLWLALRNRLMHGRKFRRQFPIGRYIADFACRDSRLVVELDGSQHIDNPADDVRNQYMNANGWSVARFASGGSLEGVLETIAAICEGRVRDFVLSPEFQFYPASSKASHTNPLPACGERGLSDDAYMRRAIALGRPGKTWPNPSVGCVLVRDGVIIAEGTTGDGGRPHAEEVALESAGAAAQGATAYVTLEPCGERSTGVCSCAQRLVEARVARVVYACDDPSPYASHKGTQRLKAAGIATEHGLLANEAAHLIAPFVHWLQTGLPLVAISDTAEGFDAEFTGTPDDLADWASKGYRHLYVRPGTPAADALQAAGLISATAKS